MLAERSTALRAARASLSHNLYISLQVTSSRDLVAGSSSGIGKAVALAFAAQKSAKSKENTKVCVMSRSKTRLQAVVEEVEQRGGQGFAVAGDLTKGADCQRAVEEAVSFVR